jgi:L,D-transpeptidase ErfK/SrfK
MTARLQIPSRVMKRFALIASSLWLLGAGGFSYSQPEKLAPIYGQAEKDMVQPEETLLDVAYRHRLGFESVARLNPKVKVWIPNPGTVIDLPTEYVLPNAPRKGIVINVPEMRLYDFTRGGEPEPYAIAIGDEMDPSLIGEFRVGAKRRNPAWTVPAAIRKEKPELPAVVPAGEDNPLGDHWMTIGSTTYGIHGTNNPWSIGRMATHGCIRLYDDQLAGLYERVPSGTPIRLIYQTVKLGTRDDGIYVEAHPDIYAHEPYRAEEALASLRAMGLESSVDARRLREAIAASRGVPVRVGTMPAPAPTTFTTSRPAS